MKEQVKKEPVKKDQLKKEQENKNSKALDIMKWIIVILFLAASVCVNIFFGDLSVPLRVGAIVLLIAVALGVAATSSQGKAAITFSKEARTEIRKVIWPTRQETVQTTFIVLAVSIVAALILWGIDSIMIRLIGFATGA